jgi:hypothetical protein
METINFDQKKLKQLEIDVKDFCLSNGNIINYHKFQI